MDLLFPVSGTHCEVERAERWPVLAYALPHGSLALIALTYILKAGIPP